MLRAILITLALMQAQAAPPTSRSAAIDEPTWLRMLTIDRKAGEVKDLTADFTQEKLTAMLKKPLVSSGRVFVRGSAMLWETKKPEPTALQITATEARIYYPADKTIEVYRIEEKLGQLAASPLPRLPTLLKYFDFAPLPLAEMKETDEASFLALKMTPSQAALAEHIEQVRVLLDARTGLIVRLEMRDTDGDRTIVSFSGAKTNTGLRDEDLTIDAPADVKISRPLAAIEAPQESKP